MRPSSCPCGSGIAESACCRPLLRGAREAADAVALMRSRFTAFASGDVEYLWRTLHPAHADRARPHDDVMRALRDVCRRVRFLGLIVLDADGAADGDEARVLFSVRAFEKRRARSFHELSRFRKDAAGAWRYFDGETAEGEAPAGLTIATWR